MIPKVFILMGISYDWEYHDEWTVAVYTTREQAEAHKAKLDPVVAGSDTIEWRKRDKIKTPYDPKMKINDKGTSYFIEEQPLVRHLDEWLEEVAENVDPEGVK